MKLPTPEACTQITQWLRGATEGHCALKHFKQSGGEYVAIFKCRVCKDVFNQAADSLSDGIPIKLQEWAAKHTHGVEIEPIEPDIEPDEESKSEPKPEPKPLPVTQGRKFRD